MPGINALPGAGRGWAGTVRVYGDRVNSKFPLKRRRSSSTFVLFQKLVAATRLGIVRFNDETGNTAQQACRYG